jgi:phenylacetate-CoA ligase
MIWNKNKECMSRDEMSALQGKREQVGELGLS